MSKHTFKVGEWVWDGDDYGSIVAIGGFIEPTVDLFDGKEGWTVDLKSISREQP